MKTVKTIKNGKKEQYIRTFNPYQWVKELQHGSMANYYLIGEQKLWGKTYAVVEEWYGGKEQLIYMNVCDYADTFTVAVD